MIMKINEFLVTITNRPKRKKTIVVVSIRKASSKNKKATNKESS